MYHPFRHDANVKESLHNSSTSNLLDSGSTARPFATSFATQSGSPPVFHHTGTIQGLHNVHGSYNMPTMLSSLSSRNSGLGAISSSGAHQPSASLAAGRYSSNNLPIGLSQLSHGGLPGHSGRGGIGVVGNHSFSSSMNGVGASMPGASSGAGAVNSRGTLSGSGVSPSTIGGAGPRIPSSGSSVVGAGIGSGIGRTISTGAGPNTSSGSRLNFGQNNGSVGLGVQGPGRPLASPQMMSLLGSNFSNNAGPSQVQTALRNGQVGSIGAANEPASSDGAAFDLSDFPQLTTRPSSSGGSQGPLATLRRQGLNSLVQQSQEFSMQNEDFPALPGFKGGSVDFASDLQQKEQQHDNAIALMQSQHFTIERSAGFSLGGAYLSHRQQQQLPQAAPGLSTSTASGSFASTTSTDIMHLHEAASDVFPTSHGLSTAYHSQVQAVGPPGVSGVQTILPSLRSGGPSNTSPGLSTYDQLIHQYQNHHNQTQFRLGPHQQQISVAGQPFREPGLKQMQGSQSGPDRFGLLGLLSVIRMSDPDLTTLALGTDLTTLGLNLNSRDNLYKTFASPWAEGPAKGEPEFTLPQCYIQQAPRLQPGYFGKFQQDTLFYIFYSMPNDEAQLYASYELSNRGWFYHKELGMWFMRVPNVEPLVKTNTYERGSYYYFNQTVWETGRKDNFVLHYEMVEKRPQLPQQH